jgi:hypothetical protein
MTLGSHNKIYVSIEKSVVCKTHIRSPAPSSNPRIERIWKQGGTFTLLATLCGTTGIVFIAYLHFEKTKLKRLALLSIISTYLPSTHEPYLGESIWILYSWQQSNRILFLEENRCATHSLGRLASCKSGGYSPQNPLLLQEVYFWIKGYRFLIGRRELKTICVRVIAHRKMTVSIKEYREILLDSTSTDTQIQERIEFIQALCKTVITYGLLNKSTDDQRRRRELEPEEND